MIEKRLEAMLFLGGWCLFALGVVGFLVGIASGQEVVLNASLAVGGIGIVLQNVLLEVLLRKGSASSGARWARLSALQRQLSRPRYFREAWRVVRRPG